MPGEYSNKTAACIIHRCIGAVLSLVLDKLSTSVSSLTPCQLDALKAFIMGTDTFVSLPTGHGKSLIYQIALPVVKELVKTYPEELSQCFPSRPMLLVVSPLNALITDQMESCSKVFGLKVARLDEFIIRENSQSHNDDIDILFTGPETLEKNYAFISCFAERLLAVVVDETHCVITW